MSKKTQNRRDPLNGRLTFGAALSILFTGCANHGTMDPGAGGASSVAASSTATSTSAGSGMMVPGCTSAADCPMGELCADDGTCHVVPKPSGCKTNADCSASETCVKDLGVCAVVGGSCQETSDCPAALVCQLGKCAVAGGCTSNADCPTCEICEVTLGVCWNSAKVHEGCAVDTDCGGTGCCDTRLCLCAHTAGGKCGVSPSPACSVGAECPAFLLTCDPAKGVCVHGCTSDAECQSGQDCDTYSNLCYRSYCGGTGDPCHSATDCCSYECNTSTMTCE